MPNPENNTERLVAIDVVNDALRVMNIHAELNRRHEDMVLARVRISTTLEQVEIN